MAWQNSPSNSFGRTLSSVEEEGFSMNVWLEGRRSSQFCGLDALIHSPPFPLSLSAFRTSQNATFANGFSSIGTELLRSSRGGNDSILLIHDGHKSSWSLNDIMQ